MIFKNYFNSISTFQKIEIYFLSIVFFYFIFYIYSTNLKVANTNIDQDKQIEIYKKAISSLKEKYSKKENIYLVKHIESICQDQSVEIENIKIEKNKIDTTINGKYQSIISFIYKIEKNLSILKLELISEDKIVKAKLSIDTKYFYNSTDHTIVKTKIANPFIAPSSKKDLDNKQKSYKLYATFNQTALINNSWYKKGDMVGDFILEKIEQNSVYLKNIKTKQIDILKVYSE